MQKTFAANAIQHIVLTDLRDSLQIRGWDQAVVEITCDDDFDIPQPVDGVLAIYNSTDALTLNVPFESVVSAQNIHDNVLVEGIRIFNLQNAHDDVTIKNIQGEVNLDAIHGDLTIENVEGQVSLGEIEGDLQITHAAQVRVLSSIRGDAILSVITKLEASHFCKEVQLSNIDTIEIATVGDELVAHDFNTLNAKHVGNDCHLDGQRESQVIIRHIGNSLHASRIGSLSVSVVGNDCTIEQSPQAQIMLQHVGDDLSIEGAGQVAISSVGDECQLHHIQGNIILGKIGNELEITACQGDVQVSTIGGNARIQEVQGALSLGSVGGNLTLRAAFLSETTSRLHAGGNATIELPVDANLTIHATVGGIINGQGIATRSLRNHATLVYGDGATQLNVIAGGNLTLQGDTAPVTINNEGESWQAYANAYDWKNFAHEMSDFGDEMGRMGQELGANIEAAFNEAIHNFDIDSSFGYFHFTPYNYQHEFAKDRHKAEKERHKAERERLKAEKEHLKGNRIYARFNEREWSMDPERIHRIIEQAQQAAAEGIQGAYEAVEQALKNLQVTPTPLSEYPAPQPPQAPQPPRPPMPSVPVTPTAPAAPETTDTADAPGQSAVENEQAAEGDGPSVANSEEEREAILRMIAEGRITPEEGDMLLEALG